MSGRVLSRRDFLGAVGGATLGSLSMSGACAGRAGRTAIRLDFGTRHQTVDGFGTCLYGESAREKWFQSLYLDDLRASMLRLDLTPRFRSPYSDFAYNCPWFHGHPPLPGPDGNNVRAYTSPEDYQRPFAGRRAAIAVMGPDIDQNVGLLDLDDNYLVAAGALAALGWSRRKELGDFKILASLWSPAPWLKLPSGNRIATQGEPHPKTGAPWPFIWAGNFAGGRLDVSGEPRQAFHDGRGPTSALTQFARGTAATLRGFMRRHGVVVDALSIQNELNFEEFYGSCTYRRAEDWLKAVAAVRAELDRYPDLEHVHMVGPEDLLGADAYGLWQFGKGAEAVDKNLRYLQALHERAGGAALIDVFAIHGYAPDGVAAADADPKLWRWWAEGWTAAPARGLPALVAGFRRFGRKSWMTETSGEQPSWKAPASGFPGDGGFGLALRIHQAMTDGYESAWLYWQLADGNPVSGSTLTDAHQREGSPKYVAAKHYFRFIRPGACRIEAATDPAHSAVVASAYLHPGDGDAVIVALNTGEVPLDVMINWSEGGGERRPREHWDVYTSGDEQLWAHTVAAAVPSRTLSCHLPAHSVATLVSSASGRGDVRP
jgi:O-glycosyl hydrolase